MVREMDTICLIYNCTNKLAMFNSRLLVITRGYSTHKIPLANEKHPQYGDLIGTTEGFYGDCFSFLIPHEYCKYPSILDY